MYICILRCEVTPNFIHVYWLNVSPQVRWLATPYFLPVKKNIVITRGPVAKQKHVKESKYGFVYMYYGDDTV